MLLASHKIENEAANMFKLRGRKEIGAMEYQPLAELL